ncbi:hypothetical protein AURANDRAFT_55367 [Aureococcus anophagefferens]|uniref:PAS domain-containing protein n=1 Tax=Aureococcus anophagefferens TaxID=44056 RepID=F0YLG8_AURAN|nr:hypothetical protein AURANDRAFT_55367 [Aureococcus anophagefferens]EGB04044.1 hypothetical protein AURANDRAFT_55367 [Aureococcus anophagefferens]|eukprot:XP_009041321.1 hypothetical protein AURANDRAFT_55367 [Aureococcus anophagefferens]
MVGTGLLELMLSEDKHGYTPLDYVVPAQQPNWRTIVDTVVSWAACDSQDSGLSGPSDAIKDVELDAIACCDHASPLSMSTRTETRLIQSLSDRIISNLRLVTADGMTITDFMRDMDATDVRVIAQLCARNCSFLVSDCADPDAAIIAVSPAFVMETGYAPGDVLGRNCRFLQGPGTSTGQVDLIRRALATQSTVKVSLLNYKKDGGTFLNCFLLTPLHANGIIRYYIGIQNCPEAIVDDRKRNVLRLQQLRQRNTPQEPNSGGWLEGTQTNVHPTRAPQALSQSKRKVGEIEIVERQDPKSRKLNDKREKAKNQCQIS